jgi:glycosyltransferase involved in cell wall biosynthesis
MKILVLGSRIPFPVHDGGAVATFGMLESMAKLGHEITYFSFNTKKHYLDVAEIKKRFHFCRVIEIPLDATPGWWPALASLYKGENYNLSRFSSSMGNQKLIELLDEERFDIIQFEGLYSTSFFPVVEKYSSAKRVLRAHNIEHRIWERLALNSKSPIKKWYLNKLAASLKREETAIIDKFQHIVPIAQLDLDEFKKMHPLADYFLYPAGVNLKDHHHASNHIALSLCHIGSMEWMPNRQAVAYFIKEIWPHILLKFPQAQFHIAGKALKENDGDFTSAGIVNHGEVEDSVNFITGYRAMVVPLLSGSGLRMKIIEAMAHSVPVISSRLGAEGLPVHPGQEILIADTLEEWLAAVSMVFSDSEQPNYIVEQARKMVQMNYSTDSLTEKLCRYYLTLIK